MTLGDKFIKGPYTLEEILDATCYIIEEPKSTSLPLAFHSSNDKEGHRTRVSVLIAIEHGFVPCSHCCDTGILHQARRRWSELRANVDG